MMIRDPNNPPVARVTEIDHIPTEEDWQTLVQKARDLENRIHTVQGKQHSYNAVLERSYVVEEAQRMEMEKLRDRVREEEVESLTNPAFAQWIKGQEETMASEKDVVSNWYNEEDLLRLTPFAAVVPYPRYLTEKGAALCEATMDQFELPSLYVQTIAVKSPMIQVAQALIPRADHLFSEDRAKSDLGPLAYVATAQSAGGDVIEMIEQVALLRETLKDTSCLLVNDRRLMAPLSFKVLVVRGRCAVGEVACSQSCLPIFQRQPATAEVEGKLLPLDVVGYALGRYVQHHLTPILKTRTYEALLLAQIRGVPAGGELSAEMLERLELQDISFQLLNMDYPDNSHFEMFCVEDLRSISGYVARRDQHGHLEVDLPPALRVVERGGAHPQSATVALAIRQLERSADRYKSFCKEAGIQPTPLAAKAKETTPASSSELEHTEDGGPSPAIPAPGTGIEQGKSKQSAGGVPASHMDPFVNLLPSEASRAMTTSNHRFFSEMESIGRILDAPEQRNLRPEA